MQKVLTALIYKAKDDKFFSRIYFQKEYLLEISLAHLNAVNLPKSHKEVI